MSPSPRAWAVIAGGGTGGHVVPAIAIGTALVSRGHPAGEIHFVGSQRGIESEMVPHAGFPLTVLPGRGIARRLTLDNVGAVAGLAAAFARALVLVRRLRPAVVVAVGGYASAAAALAAVFWRVPLVVAEQNAVPGLANRLAGRFARSCAVSFEGTPLPRAVLTGNPVRPEMAPGAAAPDRRGARAELGIDPEALVVVAAGGSLGARRINEAVLGLSGLWSDRAGICLYHVAGRRDFASLQARTGRHGGALDYRVVEFEHRMDLVLRAADVTVQRAGASTVAELTALGVASVLVPLPGAPGDHQTENARRLVEAGAAVMVADSDLDAARLARELENLMADPERCRAMADAARSLGRPDAADRVADLVEEAARG